MLLRALLCETNSTSESTDAPMRLRYIFFIADDRYAQRRLSCRASNRAGEDSPNIIAEGARDYREAPASERALVSYYCFSPARITLSIGTDTGRRARSRRQHGMLRHFAAACSVPLPDTVPPRYARRTDDDARTYCGGAAMAHIFRYMRAAFSR